MMLPAYNCFVNTMLSLLNGYNNHRHIVGFYVLDVILFYNTFTTALMTIFVYAFNI